MAPEWNRVIDRDRLYRVKELGGKGKQEHGLLGISYDSVIRKIVNRYAGIIANQNAKGTHRSLILIPGSVVLQWIRDNLHLPHRKDKD